MNSRHRSLNLARLPRKIVLHAISEKLDFNRQLQKATSRKSINCIFYAASELNRHQEQGLI
jgi:hypothetical protein